VKAGDSTFYHPELDAFRFVAFFLVFLAHTEYHVRWDWTRLHGFKYVAALSIHGAGFYGVDLFFVLSAYLITELLLREQDKTGSIHVPQFYMRRVLRIWPLYFFFLLAVRPMLPWFVHGEHLPGKTLAAFLLLAGNWSCVWWGWPPSVCSQLWSITVEEQFYLVWPLLLKRWKGKLLHAAVTMLWVANATRLLLVLHPRNDATIWCNTLSRLDPIAGGILLAWWLHGRENRLPSWVRVQLVSAGLAMLLFIGYYGDHTNWRALFSYPLADLACVMMVAGVLAPQGVWRPGVPGRVFIYLGRISYGLYVYHLVGFELVNKVVRDNIPLTMALALAVTIAIATVSYYGLELPFLRLKKRFAPVRSRDAMAGRVLTGS
jgi:peptidoglycan/LPS O-acetylase OafA/YrhL